MYSLEGEDLEDNDRMRAEKLMRICLSPKKGREESHEVDPAEDQPGAETGCNLMGIFCPNDFKREALKYVKISIMILFLLSVVDIF